MEISFINLQNSVNYLSHLPRKINSPLPVERIGFIHEKTKLIDRCFTLPSVFLVLSGSGILEQDGRRLELHAPFLIWNWPGEYKRYWPEPAWDELYIGFNPEAEQELKRLFDAEFFRHTPLAVQHPAGCMRYIAEVFKLMRHSSIPGTADRIDHMAMMILLEAVYPYQEEILNPLERKLVKIAECFHENYKQDINLTEIAELHGMSYSTFQRCWRRKYPCTPNQYLRNIRNTAALDYLRDSNLSIGDIARELGFNNQFYFSKFFRDMNGITPTEYRGRIADEYAKVTGKPYGISQP